MAQRIKKEELLFDVRLLERHLAAGLISEEEYRRHLAHLPDSAEQGLPLDLENPSRSSVPEEPSAREIQGTDA